MKNIAILGGSFNPIHNGHLSVGYAVLENKQIAIDKVLFMPTGKSPFKQTERVTRVDRIEMTKQAIVHEDKFEISEIEINQNISYTVETIKMLKMQYPEANLYFVLGMDTLENIYHWKAPQELFSLCAFILVERAGYKKNEALLSQLLKDKARIHFLKAPQISISSSQIRYRINEYLSISHLVPYDVNKYIIENNLYKTDLSQIDISQIHAQLKEKLSDKKYQHVLGVTETAVSLAKHYKEDIRKAELAGLLHDIVKQVGREETFRLIAKYHLKLDDVIMENIYLAHGPLGAVYAQDVFDVQDEDVLNAITYHTTGRAGMSPLEKIVYIADYIEPGRGENETLTAIRKKVYENLDEALELTAESVISYLEIKQQPVHPLGLDTLRDAKEQLWK